MSHKATAWAITAQNGRGLSPAAKIVLWHLADRHNPDHGCFPSQALLAENCEVSQSQLNVHLSTLERAALIRRFRQIDPKTRRQLPTRYVFAFEAGFEPLPVDEKDVGEAQPDLPLQPEPTPEIGDGADSGNEAEPTPVLQASRLRFTGVDIAEPVKEPVSEPIVQPVDEAEVDRAFAEFWSVHPRPTQRDASRQIFREAVHAGEEPRAIVSGARRYAKDQAGNKTMYVCRSDNWLKAKRWREAAGTGEVPNVEAGEIADFWAAKIKAGRYVPPSAVSPSLVRDMLARGLVDRAQLSSAGFRL